MTLFVFANNASTTLASAISNTVTTIPLAAGTGSLFPTISAGQTAAITIEDVSGDIEVCWATGKSGDNLTVLRGQEGTAALAFSSGSRVEQRVTLGVLNNLLQKTGGDTLSGTTTVSGVLALGSGGSIQGGEFTGAIRSGPGVTTNQLLVPTGGGPATVGGSAVLTTANLLSNLPAGSSLCLTGMIVLWAGLSSAVPSGWHLCDGTSGTLNLEDQFIVGGGGVLPSSGGSSSLVTGASATGLSGDSTDGHTLSITEIPSHTHQFYASLAGAASGGGVTIYSPTYTTPPAQYNLNQQGSIQINQSTGGGGAHSHTLTGLTQTHTHTVSYPPYTAVFFIQKL